MNLIADDPQRARIAETGAAFAQRSELIDVLVSAQISFMRVVQNRMRPTQGSSTRSRMISRRWPAARPLLDMLPT